MCMAHTVMMLPLSVQPTPLHSQTGTDSTQPTKSRLAVTCSQFLIAFFWANSADTAHDTKPLSSPNSLQCGKHARVP